MEDVPAAAVLADDVLPTEGAGRGVTLPVPFRREAVLLEAQRAVDDAEGAVTSTAAVPTSTTDVPSAGEGLQIPTLLLPREGPVRVATRPELQLRLA